MGRPPSSPLLLGLLLVLPAAAPVHAEGPIFVDRAADWGLDFVHFNGMTGAYYFPEMTGQGCAWFDYDGDGDLDAYLVQGALLAGDTMDEALFPYTGEGAPKDRLYRNDPVRMPDGSWEPRFVDMTDASGLDATGYGMGVTTGDYDGDGWADLYLTNYGPNQLWRNRGDGTFVEVTAEAGVGDPDWSSSASFLDYDGDGRLDLYVVNYVEFDVAKNPRCFTGGGRRDYCGPADFKPVQDHLFHNRGGGKFEDVSGPAGIAAAQGPGLGVVAGDYDGDGWTDLYVTNDGQVNFLWRNGGDGTFSDQALLAGVALNREGRAEASMGVDAGDYDGDGDLDLFMTHLMGETNTLYVNDGSGLFEDRTLEAGLGAPSFPYTSFGTGWIDYDNDGWLDLLVVSGAVRVLEEEVRAGDPYPLKQPKQLFHSAPRGEGRRFEDVTAQAGEVFALPEVSRGAAFGDVDGDGDLDVLLANNNGPARLLVNQVGQERPWIGVDVRDAEGSPAIGTRVAVERQGAPPVWRRVRTDGSYASANDPRVLAGLGDGHDPVAVRVVWPRGRVTTWRGVAARHAWTVYAEPTRPAPRKEEGR